MICFRCFIADHSCQIYVEVGLKKSQCLVHTLGKNVENKFITLFQFDIKAGNSFDVVPLFAKLWCRWDAF